MFKGWISQVTPQLCGQRGAGEQRESHELWHRKSSQHDQKLGGEGGGSTWGRNRDCNVADTCSGRRKMRLKREGKDPCNRGRVFELYQGVSKPPLRMGLEHLHYVDSMEKRSVTTHMWYLSIRHQTLFIFPFTPNPWSVSEGQRAGFVNVFPNRKEPTGGCYVEARTQAKTPRQKP